jgi:hypothetical protein
VATRQGLHAKSFDLVAEVYTEAVGRPILGDSVRRITQDWGQQVESLRNDEAQRANAPAQRGESPSTRRVPERDPIQGQANISTDGAMVLVRGEGWKEVKLTALSAVTVKEVDQPAMDHESPSREGQASKVVLGRHSYQAGLWDADTIALHQYSEGLCRGLDRCERLT